MGADAPVVLVSGSTSGIGRTVAERFAAEGARVVVNSVRSVDEGEALAASLPEAVHVQGDVAIGANAVAPGLIETPWVQDDDWEKVRGLVERRAPLGRTGTPADVAEAVLGLARATYVTGQVVVVDGGVTIR